MFEFAEFYLRCHTPNETDYTSRYRTLEIATDVTNAIQPSVQIVVESSSGLSGIPVSDLKVTASDSPLYQALKQYRLEKSREEGIKTYFLFNNAQLDDLIAVMPNTNAELKTVQGFGDVKCEKYGQDVLGIIAKYNKVQ